MKKQTIRETASKKTTIAISISSTLALFRATGLTQMLFAYSNIYLFWDMHL